MASPYYSTPVASLLFNRLNVNDLVEHLNWAWTHILILRLKREDRAIDMILVLCIFVACLLYYLWQRRNLLRLARKLKGLRGYPIIGSAYKFLDANRKCDSIALCGIRAWLRTHVFCCRNTESDQWLPSGFRWSRKILARQPAICVHRWACPCRDHSQQSAQFE